METHFNLIRDRKCNRFSCHLWLIGWLVGWLAVWVVGWLVDWLVGWLIGWLVGWLVGCLGDGYLVGGFTDGCKVLVHWWNCLALALCPLLLRSSSF